MKTNKLLIPILCLCAITAWAQDYFYAYYSDGSVKQFLTENADSISITVPRGTVTDACGNQYNYTYIGNMVWMTENMRCDKTNDGRPLGGYLIPQPCNSNCEQGCVEDYARNMTQELFDKSGYLYSGKSDIICPIGWHVPSKEEWGSFLSWLDPDATTYGIYKKWSTSKLSSKVGWYSGQGTDMFGFCAIPAGWAAVYSPGGCTSYKDAGRSACFWSSTVYQDYSGGKSYYLFKFGSGVIIADAKPASNQTFYASIRCCREKLPLEE